MGTSISADSSGLTYRTLYSTPYRIHFSELMLPIKYSTHDFLQQWNRLTNIVTTAHTHTTYNQDLPSMQLSIIISSSSFYLHSHISHSFIHSHNRFSSVWVCELRFAKGVSSSDILAVLDNNTPFSRAIGGTQDQLNFHVPPPPNTRERELNEPTTHYPPM